jgi:hypothetical protein
LSTTDSSIDFSSAKKLSLAFVIFDNSLVKPKFLSKGFSFAKFSFQMGSNYRFSRSWTYTFKRIQLLSNKNMYELRFQNKKGKISNFTQFFFFKELTEAAFSKGFSSFINPFVFILLILS